MDNQIFRSIPVFWKYLAFFLILSISIFSLFTLPSVKEPTYFSTLPPGSQLPSDATCAARIRRSSWEPIPKNTQANDTNFYNQNVKYTNTNPSWKWFLPYGNKITGNFTGTTDEIIQWAACKWGFDEDTVRAQAYNESRWDQSTLGDCNSTTVIGAHGCASMGIFQIKGADLPPTHPGTWPYVYKSTAWNLDYALAFRRACFEGAATWMGNGYHAGDLWGCIGYWGPGTYGDAANAKSAQDVKRWYDEKPWRNL